MTLSFQLNLDIMTYWAKPKKHSLHTNPLPILFFLPKLMNVCEICFLECKGKTVIYSVQKKQTLCIHTLLPIHPLYPYNRKEKKNIVYFKFWIQNFQLSYLPHFHMMNAQKAKPVPKHINQHLCLPEAWTQSSDQNRLIPVTKYKQINFFFKSKRK